MMANGITFVWCGRLKVEKSISTMTSLNFQEMDSLRERKFLVIVVVFL